MDDPFAIAIFIAIVGAVVAAILVPVIWFFVVAVPDNDD